jgi:hypothetical protein
VPADNHIALGRGKVPDAEGFVGRSADQAAIGQGEHCEDGVCVPLEGLGGSPTLNVPNAH